MGDATDTKPKAKRSDGPSTLEMVIEAVKSSEERKGATVPGIKLYVLNTYPNVDPAMLKSRLKKAFAKGLEEGVLCRPKAMEELGASLSGRYKIVKAKLAEREKPKKAKKPKKDAAEKPKKAVANKSDTSKSPSKALKAKKSPAKKAAAEKVKKAKAVASATQKKPKSPAEKKKSVEKRPAKPKTVAGKVPGKAIQTPSKAKSAKAKAASGKAR